MFEVYFSHFVLRTHNAYITGVFYFFTGFTTAYNMLWKKKLFLQPHILKRKLTHHIFVKKKGTQKKHVANVLLKKMIKNLKIMTMMIQESVLLSSLKITEIWFGNVLVE